MEKRNPNSEYLALPVQAAGLAEVEEVRQVRPGEEEFEGSKMNGQDPEFEPPAWPDLLSVGVIVALIIVVCVCVWVLVLT